MAPTKKRSSIRAKAAARSTTTASTTDPSSTSSEPRTVSTGIEPGRSYQPSKRAKRVAKHTSFLHRVSTTGLTNSSGSIKKKVKRSRGKDAKTRGKLVTSLSSLADALPDFEGFGDDDNNEDQAGNKMIGIPGLSDVNITIARTRSGNIAQEGVPKKMKSLGTKKGMSRRKEKLEAAERERFQKNVAVMMGDEKFGFGGTKVEEDQTMAEGNSEGGAGGAASGLQALRAFINRNMAIQKAL